MTVCCSFLSAAVTDLYHLCLNLLVHIIHFSSLKKQKEVLFSFFFTALPLILQISLFYSRDPHWELNPNLTPASRPTVQRCTQYSRSSELLLPELQSAKNSLLKPLASYAWINMSLYCFRY